MTIFLQTRIYMCTKKFIFVTNKHVVSVVYGVKESRRVRGTELYRQQKTPSCTMKLESNFNLNQAWPLSSNVWIGLVLIHCPHSSGGCWLPDNGFVGIRGLSLERLCTLFHEC